jgi:1,6-anhydro-N-acetylmuramate kinase
MTQQLIEQTVRDWVGANPARGARTLDRLAARTIFNAANRSTEEITQALIRLAGRIEVAQH